MAIKQVWQCSDFRVFDSQADALQHERRRELEGMIREALDQTGDPVANLVDMLKTDMDCLKLLNELVLGG